jgi:DNA-directed RNA polymerase subunit H (RpoH/RPB5)
MFSGVTPYSVHKNLLRLCAFRGATSPKPFEEAVFAATMTDPGYAIIVSDRPDSDIRGGARLVIIQFAPSFMGESAPRFKSVMMGVLAKASAGTSARMMATIELIIVTTGEPKGPVKNAAEAMRASAPEGTRITTEVYQSTKFAIVVPDHVMVPHHRILSDGDAKRICEQLHISPSDLPVIRSDDPVAIWIGLRPRMIVRVDRLVETVGIDVIYQRCV